MDASRVVVVFVRRLISFSLPPFLYLGVVVFRRFRWTLDSASDGFKLLLLSHVVDHRRPIDSPCRSHIKY